MKVCVLACSRSGTTYATKFFRKAYGLDVKHENLGPEGGIGWTMMLDRYRKLPFEEFDFVLHQVRHPGAVMRTLHTHFPTLWKLLAESVGEFPKGELQKYMAYWCRYNEKAEKIAFLTYRVEDLYDGSDTSKLIGEILDREPKPANVSKQTNTGKSRKRAITMDILRKADPEWADRVLEMSKRYQYSWDLGL